MPSAELITPLLLATHRVLKPLVRLLVRHGMSYQQMSELLKSVMVDVAQETLASGGKQTDSRVSLLTGIHRKEVKRLRDALRNDQAHAVNHVPLSAQVLATWLSRPDLQTVDGNPRPLPRSASGPGETSFDELVYGLSKDFRPRVLLDEWLRQGMASMDDADRIHLNLKAFVPHSGFEDKLFYFAHNLHDHLAAASHNLLGNTPTMLERSVHHDGVSAETVARLMALSEREGMSLLRALNTEAMAAGKADPEQARRFTFGIYFYEGASREPGVDAT